MNNQNVMEDPLVAPCSIFEPSTKLVLRRGLLSDKCLAQLGRIAKTTERRKRNCWDVWYFLNNQNVMEDPLMAPCSIFEPATKLVLRRGLLSDKCLAQLTRIAKATEHRKRNCWYLWYFLFLCVILVNFFAKKNISSYILSFWATLVPLHNLPL